MFCLCCRVRARLHRLGQHGERESDSAVIWDLQQGLLPCFPHSQQAWLPRAPPGAPWVSGSTRSLHLGASPSNGGWHHGPCQGISPTGNNKPTTWSQKKAKDSRDWNPCPLSVSTSGDMDCLYEGYFCTGRKMPETQTLGHVPRKMFAPEARDAPISRARISPSLFLFRINLIFPRNISRWWSSFSFKSSEGEKKKNIQHLAVCKL